MLDTGCGTDVTIVEFANRIKDVGAIVLTTASMALVPFPCGKVSVPEKLTDPIKFEERVAAPVTMTRFIELVR